MTAVKIHKHRETGILRWIQNRIFFFVTVLFVLVLVLIAYMYIRNALNDTSARNLVLSNDCSRLQQEIIYLESEINEYRRPGYIKRIAEEELKMIDSQPQADAIIVKKRK
ncbi:MAG: hypothetical protein U5N56_10675 [Candidatus Marinimicrobia bacterium]|nr:hypothetical protein [Candidatus Neomarinimicrobiota bacterium]